MVSALPSGFEIKAHLRLSYKHNALLIFIIRKIYSNRQNLNKSLISLELIKSSNVRGERRDE